MQRTTLMDLTGQVFMRLTVLRQAENRNGRVHWLCRCSCGKETTVFAGALRSGQTRSCGCIRRGKKITHGMTRTPEHRTWMKMTRRCLDPRADKYRYYGGRGIRVCDRWLGRRGLENFVADMGLKPSPKHEIDRIDNDGNYEPGNCRWVTRTENVRNRSNTRHLTVNGETKSRAEWSDLTGIPLSVMAHRQQRGWKPEDIVSKPVRKSVNGKYQ